MVKDVIRAPRFIQAVKRVDGSKLDRIKKLIIKIMQEPEIGKPMRYDRKGTREIYVRSFRLSYSYDKSIDTIYLLDLYHKDEQ